MQAAFDIDRALLEERAQAAEGLRRGGAMTITALVIAFCTYAVPDLQAWYTQTVGWILVGLGIARIVKGVREAHATHI
jgi:hypothetical protein